MVKRIYHYEILSELGRGGTSVVYRAMDTRLKREVALKVLPKNRYPNESFEQRFLQEAETAAGLNHPNIVTVHAAGKSPSGLYIAMELVDKGSLQSLVKTAGTLSNARIRTLGVQISAGLQEAHSKGIIHRDIKPENILFDSRGDVRITDFGIAKVGDGPNLTQEGFNIGTPHYMSPEQAQGKEIDIRSDLYSLGAVLYEAATGQTPFTGEDTIAIGIKHIKEKAPPPIKLNQNLDPELNAIILKCLRKDPDERYQSAEELGAQLELGPSLPTTKRRVRKTVSMKVDPITQQWVASDWTRFGFRKNSLTTGVMLSVVLFIGAATAWWLGPWGPDAPGEPIPIVQERGTPNIRPVPRNPSGSEPNVTIDSDPKRAVVYINHQRRGVTPLPVRLPQGNHQIRLMHSGYQDTVASLQIGTGETVVKLNLKPNSKKATRKGTEYSTGNATNEPDLERPATVSTVFVTTIPDGAKVTVDHVPQGVTPLQIQVDAKTKRVTVEKPGYLRYSTSVSKFGRKDIHIELKPIDEPIVAIEPESGSP
ncbi:MAG: protein kinase [Okeania sp. SIO1H5]|uniref:serine/threonine-protein kinase n=1 Tax=Okeania sp. SIO1H5 TaxID=2607777 RepID=UPI0013B67F28|nr:serine/threonine-protein kinase [Okeania sp. SIO1H5]NET23693.1 protein kinase [Okeania sp. SIO1H5]